VHDKINTVGAKGKKGKKRVKCEGKISKNSKKKGTIGAMKTLQNNSSFVTQFSRFCVDSSKYFSSLRLV